MPRGLTGVKKIDIGFGGALLTVHVVCLSGGKRNEFVDAAISTCAHFLSEWVRSEQKKALEYLQAENEVLREKLGDGRVLLDDNQRRRLAVKGNLSVAIAPPCLRDTIFVGVKIVSA